MKKMEKVDEKIVQIRTNASRTDRIYSSYANDLPVGKQYCGVFLSTLCIFYVQLTA